VVATIHRHGTPHLAPNGYRDDGQVLTSVTRKARLQYRHLQRDPRTSGGIDDPPAAAHAVVLSGTATCPDQDIWEEARRIIARSRAPDAVDDDRARWKTEPRGLVTVPPERLAIRAPRRQ
jgi:hypothetical protein